MDSKLNYYLEIADNAFILSHRLSEYSSNGPYLEEDLAITNVALDLIGLAEMIYTEIAKEANDGRSADDIAYRRNESEYVNCLLMEQPNTDFAHIMTRQFFTDLYHFYLFTELENSKDDFLKAVGTKSLKEVRYHLKRSSEWMIRFGNGTEESIERAQSALDTLWKYTDELFTENAELESVVGINTEVMKANWNKRLDEILSLAKLEKPSNNYQIHGGKSGNHTEYLGKILCDIQYLTNKYPDAQW